MIAQQDLLSALLTQAAATQSSIQGLVAVVQKQSSVMQDALSKPDANAEIVRKALESNADVIKVFAATQKESIENAKQMAKLMADDKEDKFLKGLNYGQSMKDATERFTSMGRRTRAMQLERLVQGVMNKHFTAEEVLNLRCEHYSRFLLERYFLQATSENVFKL